MEQKEYLKLPYLAIIFLNLTMPTQSIIAVSKQEANSSEQLQPSPEEVPNFYNQFY